MNEIYGKPGRFRLAAKTLPMPVQDVSPREPLLSAGPHPAYTIELKPGANVAGVGCFHSHAGKQELTLDGNRISFQPDGNARPGRSRFNCTAPAGDGQFHWYGRQYVTPGGRD